MADDGNIRGAGGGDEKKQRTPVEAPDSLHSVAYARIDDLVSEGPIRGLADGLKSIFFNETPLQNADGSLNFKNVQVDWRLGTQDQDPIPGFDTVENEIGVSVELRADQQWTQALNNIAMDGVRIRLSTPQMVKTDSATYDRVGTSVSYAIDVATDGGAFETVLTTAITGKTTSKYERSHRIDLPAAQSGWVVRVRRLTPDSSSDTTHNSTFIESYTELVDAKLRYPNSAHIATVIDASQFQAIPTRAFDLYGFSAVPIPANYDPDTRTYATTGPGTNNGVWDGTFKPAWTDNPAWHFNLICTHKRFGLGHLVDASQVNKWALYRIARWCDDLVPDGFGGMEPRLTCNLFLQTRADAYKVLQDMASIFRGVAYWAGGAIMASADQPTDPVYVYTPANVVNGKFEYAGSSRRARHTVALCWWNDPEDFYRPKPEYVEDLEGIARYGVNQTEVIAIGSTSRGQARRMGRAILTTERLETDVVTFAVGLEGTKAAPGQVIGIADPLRMGRRMGGRISSSTTTSIMVDRLPDPLPAAGAVLNVIGSGGTLAGRAITAIDSETRTITVGVPFDTLPVPQSVWAIDAPDLTIPYYRVLSVLESEEMVYTITALSHEPDKYDYIDTLDPIEPRVPKPTPASDLIAQVTVEAFNRTSEYNTETVVAADWEPPTNAKSYEVSWRKDDGNWSAPVRQAESRSEFPKAFPGTYLCRVAPIGATGQPRSATYSNQFVLADEQAPPGFVTEITGDVDGLGQDIADEAAARLAEDAALAQQIIDEANERAQDIIDEAQARTNAIADEAQVRADAILNAKNDVQAQIETEETTRQSADESLAVAISLVSAGSGEQFDSRKIWYYDADLEAWTGNGAPTIVDGWMRPANHASDPWVASPTDLAVEGQSYRFVKLRIKRVGSPVWAGELRWRTINSPPNSWNGVIPIAEPPFDANGVAVISWQDVAWWPATIDQIRLDLSTAQAATNYYLIDWVAVGRPTPGAGVALVQEESLARIGGDTAEAAQRTTLAVQMRGNYTGTDAAGVTQGLFYSERTARVNADSAIASDVVSIQARMPTGTGKVATEASVTTEASTRATADSANASDILTIQARLPSGSDQLATQASVTTEASARANADGALGTRTGAIEARMPSGTGGLATAASVLAAEQARASGDSALASSLTSVNARFGTQPSLKLAAGDIPLDSWIRVTGSGEVSSVASGTESNFGARLLQIGNNSGNDEAWERYAYPMPFDPSKLYRVRTRFRRNAGSTGSIYAGLAAMNADQSQYVSTTGSLSSSMGNSYYVAAAKTNEDYVDYVGYFRGQTSGARTGAGTLESPWTINKQAKFIAPMFVGNYSNQTGICYLDHIIIEDADGADETAANSSATLVMEARVDDVEGELNAQGALVAQVTAQADDTAQVVQSFTANAGPGGAYAQATVMVDVNNRIAGTRLTNDGEESDFTILADNFAVIDPTGGSRLEWSSGNIRVYDTNNVLRVRLGVW